MSGWGYAIGAVTSALGQSRANRENREEAQRNRRFQKEMSNTAVRRRMEDMRLGGINPLLAGKHEASTPGGSQAAPMKNILEGSASAATAAANLALIKANVRLTEAKADSIKPVSESADDVGDSIATAKEKVGGLRGLMQATGKWIGETTAKGKIAYDTGKENLQHQMNQSRMEDNLSDLADQLARLNKQKSNILSQDKPIPDWLYKQIRDTKLAIKMQQQDLRRKRK